MMLYVNLTTLLQSTTVITTILQYLSGALVSYKYIAKKSTGDSSGFPFICGFLSCSLWLKYGVLAQESLVILVNIIGTTLFLLYVVIYWMFTINKKSTTRQLTFALTILLGSIYYTQIYEENPRKALEVMGYLCCTITVVFFAAPCCMLLQVFRIKSTEMLPFPLILTSFLVSIQWFIVGLLINDLFLQIPNFIGSLLSGTQLLLFVIYPSKPTIHLTPCNEPPYSIFTNVM